MPGARVHLFRHLRALVAACVLLWSSLPEAQDRPSTAAGGGTQAEGGIPSAAPGGPPQPPPRATIELPDSPRTTVVLRTPGLAPIILEVKDAGSPSLYAYRRVILQSARGGA